MPDDRHVVLVGLMGTGKTTLGRALARHLRRPLLDSDELIESRTGRTVREIWADEGEAAFRLLETDALREALAAPQPSVIAAAGGVVLSADNRALLVGSGARVIWLQADPVVLEARVAEQTHRPLLDGDPLGTLRRMERDRAALYAEVATETLVTAGRPVRELVEAVLG